MLTKKAIIALSIFSILFTSAWHVQIKIDRRHQIDHPETMMNEDPSAVEISEYRPYGIHDPHGVISERIKPFAPREYIRIRDRWDSNP